MKIKVHSIQWDTDSEDVDLPEEVIVDLAELGSENPEEGIADYLSKTYGFCVIAFLVESIA